MNSLAILALAFLCPVAGAFVGMAFRRRLPQHHLSRDSTDVIKLATGLMATLVALVLGLLVSSANSFHGTVESEYKQALVDIIQLDRYLEAYGPEARELRALGRRIVAQTFQQRWPDEDFGPKETARAADKEPLIELERRILALTPTDAAQKWFQSQALQLTQRLVAVRQLLSSAEFGKTPAAAHPDRRACLQLRDICQLQPVRAAEPDGRRRPGRVRAGRGGRRFPDRGAQQSVRRAAAAPERAGPCRSRGIDTVIAS